MTDNDEMRPFYLIRQKAYLWKVGQFVDMYMVRDGALHVKV